MLTGGAGTVDPLTGAADVRWDGDLTVVLADGAGLVWVADPRLEVSADGSGRLLAQVQAAGRGVTTGAAEVTLAELDAVDVAAGTQQLTPAFLGVGWSGTPPQDTTGSSWGAFPASFLDLVGQAGLAVPWYSTGDPDDAAKPPLPVHLQLPAPEPPPSPLPSPPTSPPPDPGGVDVTDAQFRWGLNQEVGNAAFAPGTVNLLSAGRVPSTGPDQQIGADRWAATAGSVRIEKRQPDGSYALATFAGTRTTPAGQPLTTPSAGLWSDHQVVLDGGTGQVDVAAGEATVRWDGDFTVALYSGLTFFHVSDPVLTVAAGRGQVTATLGGYAADRADPTAWLPLPETPVVLADLGGVVLGAQGFTATPAYLGVGYDPPPGSSTAVQLREGATWGSFPRSFVDFQVAVGQGSYWYSSGGPTDRG
ncbi:hypothetical protein [Modestobacter versicolor]|uniref:Htaa domain-containing protein n=1 Tax=Modestobacter versicolor TaxID=429133 RepID=A0A323V2J0_9ACTN|nr:hypothetical protein [Modestobacter versicolor]PZA18967.1 hypothetical protein DMO24_23245 [Modestobacter versicolor]